MFEDEPVVKFKKPYSHTPKRALASQYRTMLGATKIVETSLVHLRYTQQVPDDMITKLGNQHALVSKRLAMLQQGIVELFTLAGLNIKTKSKEQK